MGEPLCQEKLNEEKKPLRINLILTTTWGDVGSLDPFWKTLLSRRMFEIAKWQRARSQESFCILSDKADLSISFPSQQPSRFFVASCVLGVAIGFLLFFLRATPLLGIPVVAAFSGLAGILVSRHTSAEFSVRGDLPDIISISDGLALWLSAGSGRKVHLETWEKVRLEAEARRPEDVQPMFKAAADAQEQGS